MILYKYCIIEAFMTPNCSEMLPVKLNTNYCEKNLTNFPDSWFIKTINSCPTSKLTPGARVYLSYEGYLANRSAILKRYSNYLGSMNTLSENEDIINKMFLRTHKRLEENARKYIESLEDKLSFARKIYTDNFTINL